MLGFPRFRSKYQGPVNKLAYVGMLGDVVVAVGLYTAYKYWKNRKELQAPINAAKQAKVNL